MDRHDESRFRERGAQHPQYPKRHVVVKSSSWLVEDEDVRFGYERPPQAKTGPLPTREVSAGDTGRCRGQGPSMVQLHIMKYGFQFPGGRSGASDEQVRGDRAGDKQRRVLPGRCPYGSRRVESLSLCEEQRYGKSCE